MPTITLDRTDVALFADPEATRIVLPRLQAQQRTRQPEIALVRFEGDQSPTLFRGEGLGVVYDMTARFIDAAEHATAAALLDLFDMAYSDDVADGRLQLRPHAGLAAGLNPFEVVAVTDVNEGGQSVGGTWDISFTATRVAFTVEV